MPPPTTPAKEKNFVIPAKICYPKQMNYKDIITIEAGKRGGKPCIRGMRMTVYDVLEYLASGMSEKEILDDFPYPEITIRTLLNHRSGLRNYSFLPIKK